MENELSIRERALIEVEKAKPSSEPSFWAKRNCKYCYGRGVEGRVTITVTGDNKVVNDCLCVCARKRFAKWREEWINTWIFLEQSKVLTNS